MAGKRSNGEGTYTYSRERKRWDARITVATVVDPETGRRIQRRKRFRAATKKEAQAKVADYLRRIEAGETVHSETDRRQTVGDWLTSWLENQRTQIAPATHDQYASYVRSQLIPRIGSVRLTQLTPSHVERMLADQEADGYSANTRRLTRAVLRRALRYAERDQLVSRNVAALADGPRVARDRKRVEVLTADELAAFFDYLDSDAATPAVRRLRASWVVTAAAGLRRGEVLGLEWDNVDLDGRTLRITRTLKRTSATGLVLSDPKTSSSRRSVRLPSVAVEALRQHRIEQHRERLAAGPEWVAKPLLADLTFRTAFGTPVEPSNWSTMTQNVTREALGRPVSPHLLRHTAASLLIAQGVGLKEVSEALGHANISMTADTYGHLYDDARQDVADAMDRALSR